MTAPTVGRVVHVHWETARYVGGPVAAIITGGDDSGIWVTAFPPPGSPIFDPGTPPNHPAAIPLYLPLTEGEFMSVGGFRGCWRWPPRV